VFGCPGVLAFVFQEPHDRSLSDANPSASGVPVKRWFLGILVACSLRSSRNKIPAIPLRAFDIPAFENALRGMHRLRSCGPNTKGRTMSDNKKPTAKITLHPVSAAIWANETEKGVFYSVTFERSYKDDANKWHTSSSFTGNELLLLAKVADQAHSKIHELRANNRQAQPEDQAA
jgi:hypothetical protein